MECPICNQSTDNTSKRLIKDTCGHKKCRLCLLQEENGCTICKNSDPTLHVINAIGDFDYPLPISEPPNYENPNFKTHKINANALPDNCEFFNHLSIEEQLAINKDHTEHIEPNCLKELMTEEDINKNEQSKSNSENKYQLHTEGKQSDCTPEKSISNNSPKTLVKIVLSQKQFDNLEQPNNNIHIIVNSTIKDSDIIGKAEEIKIKYMDSSQSNITTETFSSDQHSEQVSSDQAISNPVQSLNYKNSNSPISASINKELDIYINTNLQGMENNHNKQIDISDVQYLLHFNNPNYQLTDTKSSFNKNFDININTNSSEIGEIQTDRTITRSAQSVSYKSLNSELTDLSSLNNSFNMSINTNSLVEMQESETHQAITSSDQYIDYNNTDYQLNSPARVEETQTNQACNSTAQFLGCNNPDYKLIDLSSLNKKDNANIINSSGEIEKNLTNQVFTNPVQSVDCKSPDLKLCDVLPFKKKHALYLKLLSGVEENQANPVTTDLVQSAAYTSNLHSPEEKFASNMNSPEQLKENQTVQEIASPAQSLTYKSPAYNLSDFITFKSGQPININSPRSENQTNKESASPAQTGTYQSPGYNLSDYVILQNRQTANISSPKGVRENQFDQTSASPAQSITYHSPGYNLSDYLTFQNGQTKNINLPEGVKENPFDQGIASSAQSVAYKSPGYKLSDFLTFKNRLITNINSPRRVEENHELDNSSIQLMNDCETTQKFKHSHISNKIDPTTNPSSSGITEESHNEQIGDNHSKIESAELEHDTAKVEENKLNEDDKNKENTIKDSVVLEENRNLDPVSFNQPSTKRKRKNINNEKNSKSSSSEKKYKTKKEKDQNKESTKKTVIRKGTRKRKQDKNKEQDQNKENTKKTVIRKGTRKRKPKVLVYENENLEIPQKQTGKRGRRKKDWSLIVQVPGTTDMFECTVCKKTFKNERGKYYHGSCIYSGKPAFTCDICDRTFAKRSHFEYHQRVHLGEKPFSCNICDKSFVQKYKLNRHLSTHNDQNWVECEICGKRFTTKEYLKKHIITHQGNSFQCQFCPKTFTLNFTKVRHERSHHSPSSKSFKCDKCRKSFQDKFLLARHKQIHDKNRPHFNCNQCKKYFLSKFEVQRHIKTVHSKVKQYVCHFCDQRFCRKDNLNRHVKDHHPDKEIIEKPIAAQIISEKETEQQRKKRNEPPPLISKTKPKKISNNKSSSKSPQSTMSNDSQSLDKYDSHLYLNQVPVIKGPVSLTPLQKLSEKTTTDKHTDPISREDAWVINQRIEQKIKNSCAIFVNAPVAEAVNLKSKISKERLKTAHSSKEETQGEKPETGHELNSLINEIHTHWTVKKPDT